MRVIVLFLYSTRGDVRSAFGLSKGAARGHTIARDDVPGGRVERDGGGGDEERQF